MGNRFTLPHRMTLTQARASRERALASLSRDEFRLVECAFTEGAHVFGSMNGDGAALLSKFVPAVPPKRKGTEREERMENGDRLLVALVRSGWLRFARGASGDNCGYFWPTDSALTLWRALQEKATVAEFERRRAGEAL